MSKFTPGPWAIYGSIIRAEDGDECHIATVSQWGGDPEAAANGNLIAACPDMFAAIDAADTAFAVLNVQDLGGQARQCIREAWPLVQSARAKARPDSGYADAVKEVQQHEIARLDGIIADMRDRLADIASVLKDCPGVDVGNSKVHYAYHVAQGASNDQA